MNRFALISLVPLAVAAPTLALAAQHEHHAPAAPPTQPTRQARPAPPPAAAPQDPHAGHDMPAAAPMEDMSAPQAGGKTMGEMEVPAGPPPPPPSDHAADQVFPPTAMAAARRQLLREHGGGATPYAKVMVNLAEYGVGDGPDSFRWDGEAWLGGDIHRLVLKSEGEGERGGDIENAELQALYSRAVGVYTDVQIGVRQDFEPHGRTYLTVGAESLFPYWFDVEGAAFLSNKGDLSARIEGTYDLRLTNRLILQPLAELNFAAQDDAATLTGSGLSNAELGLRLRYEIQREFAPYVGVSYDRKFGGTADYARAAGEDVEDTRVVFGVRAWF
jgi:copper resistance protein B